MLFDDSKYKMIPEETRHEMKQLISIANSLLHDEKRTRVQVLLQNFTQRCFDVFDKLAEGYLK